MSVRIVRLGSPRSAGEGLRIGAVRRPPRGVPKRDYARRDFFDVWLPEIAPSESLVGMAQGVDDERTWRAFVRRYRAEMARPPARRLVDLLSALSHTTRLSVGCYCTDERRCHRSVLRQLLVEAGARLAKDDNRAGRNGRSRGGGRAQRSRV